MRIEYDFVPLEMKKKTAQRRERKKGSEARLGSGSGSGFRVGFVKGNDRGGGTEIEGERACV